MPTGDDRRADRCDPPPVDGPTTMSMTIDIVRTAAMPATHTPAAKPVARQRKTALHASPAPSSATAIWTAVTAPAPEASTSGDSPGPRITTGAATTPTPASSQLRSRCSDLA